jgi:hypothetical protein
VSGPETDRPAVSLALELAEIRRSVDVGFARTDGQLALVLQRVDQSDGQVAELKDEVASLRGEVEELKRRRFPIPIVGALTGLAALAVALIPLLTR